MSDFKSSFTDLPGGGGGRSDIGIEGMGAFNTIAVEQQRQAEQAAFNPVVNMSPRLIRGDKRFWIDPNCLNDNRMHAHFTTDKGDVEFWLQENDMPTVSLKDASNFKGNVKAAQSVIEANQGALVRGWLAHAKDHIIGQKHYPDWLAFAKKHGFVDDNNNEGG